MKHVCDTARLRIFRSTVQPADHYVDRILYVAFRTDEDRPMPCATCMIGIADFVDWIEVASEYRRQGFGTELLRAVQKDVDEELWIEGGSKSGKAFVANFEMR